MLRQMMVVAFAACAASYPAPAMAQQPQNQRDLVVEGQRQHIDPETQRVVQFADLNISNPAGRKILMRRVTYAVNDLCEISSTAAFDSTSAMNLPKRECVRAAWNSANPQIEQVFALAQSGTPLAAASIVVGASK